MAKITVYCDYLEDQLSPIWMLIKFGKGNIDWTKKIVYVPLDYPFERKLAEEFLDDELSFSITQSDLTIHYNKPSCFGISLTTVKKRINQLRGDPLVFPFRLDDIEQFIVQVGDIESVTAMGNYELFSSR